MAYMLKVTILLFLLLIPRNLLYVLFFYHWRNRNFSLTKYISTNNNILLKLHYDKTNNLVKLNINQITLSFTMPSSFNGKKKLFYG